MYQFFLYLGAVTPQKLGFSEYDLLSVKLLNWEFLTLPANEILDPVSHERRASLLSLKAGLHGHILYTRNARQPWDDTERAAPETHLCQCLKSTKKALARWLIWLGHQPIHQKLEIRFLVGAHT